MNFLPVIFAGGFGTRLFPISTEDTPKQFLKLTINNISLFQGAVLRASKITNQNRIKKIVIIINQKHLKLTMQQLNEINCKAYLIILEPENNNNFTSSLIALKLAEIYGAEKIAIMPSDHLIFDLNSFYKNLQLSLSNNTNNHFLFGIKPTNANTNYGYIITGKDYNGVFDIENFIEKPNKQDAENYIKTKKCFWNSGIYVLNANVFLEEVKLFQEKSYHTYACLDVLKTENDNIFEIKKEQQMLITNTSIDYAIINKSKNLKCIKADFDWIDVGSFDSLKTLACNLLLKNDIQV